MPEATPELYGWLSKKWTEHFAQAIDAMLGERAGSPGFSGTLFAGSFFRSWRSRVLAAAHSEREVRAGTARGAQNRDRHRGPSPAAEASRSGPIPVDGTFARCRTARECL